MQNILYSILEHINIKSSFNYFWLVGITIPLVLFAFGTRKIRQWYQHGIIQSKAIVNLLSFLLAAVASAIGSSVFILPYSAFRLRALAIAVFINTLFLAWVIAGLATKKNSNSKKDKIDERLQNDYKDEIKQFISIVIAGPIGVFLFLIILVAIVVIQAKFFK